MPRTIEFQPENNTTSTKWTVECAVYVRKWDFEIFEFKVYLVLKLFLLCSPVEALIIHLHDSVRNTSYFKSCIFNSAMMSIGREIARELHAYITEHGLDGAGWFIITRESMHSSAVHATETHGTRKVMNRRIEWPSFEGPISNSTGMFHSFALIVNSTGSNQIVEIAPAFWYVYLRQNV